ncbi:MAG: glycosyltransferase [Burkholderiaceae bacterium]|nr:glycosyltransferase [Burkholderiaceae bacterium]
MKPVRLAASATAALPRWGLLLLALLYILPGLIGRDPWKSDEAAGFGIMWTMAHGPLSDWLSPNIIGLAIPDEGPLAFWVGALCIQMFGPLLGDVLAARVANIIFFSLGASALWFAAYRLGQRSEAQPMELAFGGQPEPRDYGRVLADGTLLIYIGCIGLLQHSHETRAEALFVSLIACALYAIVRYLETPGRRSACLIGVTFGCLTLTRGWIVPLGLFLTLLLFLLCWLRLGIRQIVTHVCAVLLISLAIPALWLGGAFLTLPDAQKLSDAWMAWNISQIGVPNLGAIRFFLKNSLLFCWPAWPFALWAVYAWRRQRHDLHIALPLAFIILFTVLALLSPQAEETSLLPLLPPLALLAAFGLPTMRRGAINAVDWFSVMALTACAAFIWIGWIAKQTGWPAQLAKNALKLAPGFQPEINLLALLIATGATAAWFLLTYWRISRQPTVLWRAVVLSSGGVILCWLLLSTLWLPWINYGKSYVSVAQQIAQQLPSRETCIDAHLSPALRASIAYLGNLSFSEPGSSKCDYMLLHDRLNRSSRKNDPIVLPETGSQWQLVWRGRRPADRDERFHLYQRIK